MVIAVGKTPEFAASRNEDNERVQKLAQRIFTGELWLPVADGRLIQRLKERSCGITVEPQNPDLWVARYQRDKLQICFIVNTTTEPITATVNLPNWQQASLWFPDNGEIQLAKAVHGGKGLKATVTVSALDSVFILNL